MKATVKTRSAIVYRSLLVVLLVLLGVLLGGTVYALFFRDNSSAAASSGPLAPSSYPSNTAEQYFNGIGRLRLTTAESATVILSITFPYNPQDRAFSEELAARVTDFRAISESYFYSLKAEELINIKEEEIKADLLARFNSVLRLGKIEILYFNDFMILD